MKKVALFILALIALSQSLAHASGFLPGGKCRQYGREEWECGLTAYMNCVEKFKVWDPTKYNPTGGPLGGYVVTPGPGTPEFEACTKSEKTLCLQKKGCL